MTAFLGGWNSYSPNDEGIRTVIVSDPFLVSWRYLHKESWCYRCLCANGRNLPFAFLMSKPSVRLRHPSRPSMRHPDTITQGNRGLHRIELAHRTGDDGKARTEGFCVSGCAAALLCASERQRTLRLVLRARGLFQP